MTYWYLTGRWGRPFPTGADRQARRNGSLRISPTARSVTSDARRRHALAGVGCALRGGPHAHSDDAPPSPTL